MYGFGTTVDCAAAAVSRTSSTVSAARVMMTPGCKTIWQGCPPTHVSAMIRPATSPVMETSGLVAVEPVGGLRLHKKQIRHWPTRGWSAAYSVSPIVNDAATADGKFARQ